MVGKGRRFSDEEVCRIVSLLSSTDMSLQQIAERMARSHASIVSINRRLQIRNYSGRRSTWEVPLESPVTGPDSVSNSLRKLAA